MVGWSKVSVWEQPGNEATCHHVQCSGTAFCYNHLMQQVSHFKDINPCSSFLLPAEQCIISFYCSTQQHVSCWVVLWARGQMNTAMQKRQYALVQKKSQGAILNLQFSASSHSLTMHTTPRLEQQGKYTILMTLDNWSTFLSSQTGPGAMKQTAPKPTLLMA